MLTPAWRVTIMDRNKFVHQTVGREIRRACEHTGDPSLADAFDQLDHSTTGWIDVRWWSGDELRVMNRYQLTDVASNRPPIDEDDSGYEPDADLPPAHKHDLQVAVYHGGTSPEHRLNIIYAPAARTEREHFAIIDSSLGLIVLAGE